MFNAIKAVNQLVLASTRIFSGLGTMSVKTGRTRKVRKMQDTDREENTDPCEDYTCRRECLKKNIRSDIPHERNIMIFTSPTALAKGGGK
jgi:hypothetical protein